MRMNGIGRIQGLALLTMTQYIPSMKHEVVFWTAACMVALASGVQKPRLESFAVDQYDDNHSEERKRKMSLFNWWNIASFCGVFLGVTVISYVGAHVSWGVAFLTPTIAKAITSLCYVIGRPFYRYRSPQGSPFIPLLQAFVAAMTKRRLHHPSDPALLYEVSESEYVGRRRLVHTDGLRCLDKAAIIEEYESNGSSPRENSPWRLATVTQVEELKIILTIIPIWITCSIFGMGIAQVPLFFVSQASEMNRRIFRHFEIPQASMIALATLATLMSIVFYERLLLPYLRKTRRKERGISIYKRMGIGMVLLIISMLVAGFVERERRKESRADKRMNVLWLAAQFLVIGIGEGFFLVGMQEYFYQQVPDHMRNLGATFNLSSGGVGILLNTALIRFLAYVTRRGDTWIGFNVSRSKLDYFYYLLAIILQSLL